MLAIHVDRGFSLTEKATQKELWSQPYANLCSSNDDGAKLLWLQFRGRQEEDEFVLQQTNPKVSGRVPLTIWGVRSFARFC